MIFLVVVVVASLVFFNNHLKPEKSSGPFCETRFCLVHVTMGLEKALVLQSPGETLSLDNARLLTLAFSLLLGSNLAPIKIW